MWPSAVGPLTRVARRARRASFLTFTFSASATRIRGPSAAALGDRLGLPGRLAQLPAAHRQLCCESALALLDLSDSIPDAVHLLVPRKHRGLRRPPGVLLHTHPDNEAIPTVWRDGLPLTAPARTLLDVAPRVQPEQLSMAVTQGLQRGLLTTGQLREEAARRNKQNTVQAILPGGAHA